MLKLIIVREFLARVRNKSFVLMTFMSPILVFIMFGVIAYLTKINDSEIKHIAVFDQTDILKNILFDTEQIQYRFLDDISVAEAKKQTAEDETTYGLIVKTEADAQVSFFSNESVSPVLISNIENKLKEYYQNQALINRGIDPTTFYDNPENTLISIQNYTGKETSKTNSYVKMIFGGFAGYLIMMFIVIYGNMVMRSVIEEKTNRVIEIIISSVKPFDLMMGKILGTTMAGLLQFTIWIFIGFLLLQLFGNLQGAYPQTIADTQTSAFNLTVILKEILALPLGFMIVSFLLFFTGGYFLYSSIYAAIGAAVDNETDTQQFMLPILLPLILGVYIGFFTVIENPHGTVSTVFSMIPFTAPIVMLMRIPFGVPWWQWVISLLLLFGTFLIVVWFAGKIYRVGILMYGKKPSYRELIRWLKHK
ncbi:MAG: ABC transporter permease [Flavobacteriaceae bacterium]|nr:ABC transporter permease [Flavobacteriaceae bacterium]